MKLWTIFMLFRFDRLVKRVYEKITKVNPRLFKSVNSSSGKHMLMSFFEMPFWLLCGIDQCGIYFWYHTSRIYVDLFLRMEQLCQSLVQWAFSHICWCFLFSLFVQNRRNESVIESRYSIIYSLFYCQITKLREGNVFGRVCNSVDGVRARRLLGGVGTGF